MTESDLISHLDTDTNQVKAKRKKRLWREIEALKDKYKLRRELQDLDMLNDYDLQKLDI
ncbi:DUF3545 family protein [Paraneptunicella aestuarii]|uniref:DUF3545 family protein n=1 Tax=Paraneptunicella aestuarii TaxID=2831148 RepID=UPI001E5A5CBA|nr:DUF3545 family protein [Paraneptunicella aestuarii]UAA39776.1 DUF3545 family protein [Paraneptunicella aestuarii]